MSINAMEKVLWQVYTNHAETQRYNQDPQAYLQDYKLEANEREMLLSYDVMAMIDHGVNPMIVLMGFQTIIGIERYPEYVETVNKALAGRS